MRLIKLSCNQKSFRTIEFNPCGLTLILGTKTESENNEKSSSVNGVGKTQALRLIHFCLGAKNDSEIAKTLKYAVPNWLFRLDFIIDDREHYIERSGDSTTLRIDNEDTSYAGMIKWLNSAKVFPKLQDRKFITFRSLFSRFARIKQEDSIEPTKLHKETEYTSLINTAYLLNLDLELIEQKYQLKAKLEANKKTKTLISKDSYLADIFKAGKSPSVRKKTLEQNIKKINNSLDNFTIAEDYYAIERLAEELTIRSRDIQRKITALNFKTKSIDKSLQQNPDIDSQALLQLYEGLEQLFRPEVLAHFETVQSFHNDITINRLSRLEKEKIAIKIQIEELDQEFQSISAERDRKLALLKDKHALDEYLALTKELTTYNEELTQVSRYLSMDDNIKEQNLHLKKQILDVIEKALEYSKTEPLSTSNSRFEEITSNIYKNLNSSVSMDVIDSDNNQMTYNISVELETDSSDGVSSIKVMAFDWLIYQYGYHNMHMLWHDNRLFADIDPEDLALWFRFVSDELTASNKQYIASININNYEDMKVFLPRETLQSLDNSVALILKGDTPTNKLMGINFDKQRNKS